MFLNEPVGLVRVSKGAIETGQSFKRTKWDWIEVLREWVGLFLMESEGLVRVFK